MRIHFLLLICCLVTGLAKADAQTYEALMNSGHMVPPGFEPGVAQGLVSLTNNNTQIAVDLSWSGMQGITHGAGIYGPAGPGTNASALFFVSMPTGQSGTSPRQTFSITPTQVGYLTNGLLYMQIDASLRGQLYLKPPPPVYWQLLVSTNGKGSVIVNPPGTTQTNNQVVTLTATAAANYIFTGWSGNASGTNNPLSVTMNTNKAIVANFQFLTNGAPTAIELAARIAWLAQTNVNYQVQAASALDSNVWENLGGVVAGNGTTNYYLDLMGGRQKRFYRVITQP